MSPPDLVRPIDKPESLNSTGTADTERDVAVNENVIDHTETVRD